MGHPVLWRSTHISEARCGAPGFGVVHPHIKIDVWGTRICGGLDGYGGYGGGFVAGFFGAGGP
jgi:hypothetical protein